MIRGAEHLHNVCVFVVVAVCFFLTPFDDYFYVVDFFFFFVLFLVAKSFHSVFPAI